MKFASIILCLVASLTSSCTITYLQLNSSQLQPASEAFAAEDYDLCHDLLYDLKLKDFIIGVQHEYAYLRGMSAHRLGKTTDAIKQLSDYLTLPGAVPSRMRVVEEFLLGYAKQYLDGDIKAFWIFSTPGNGFNILEHLAIMASDIEIQAQANAMVAEHYFENRRYKLAVGFYSRLLNPRFASLGWGDRALYRFTECRYLMLIPKKSDEQSIMFALKSAKSYLEMYPAGLNRVDVEAIAADCITELSKMHFVIAEYYVTIGNPIGAEHHFKLASGQESQGDTSKVGLIPISNPVAQMASQRLTEYVY